MWIIEKGGYSRSLSIYIYVTHIYIYICIYRCVYNVCICFLAASTQSELELGLSLGYLGSQSSGQERPESLEPQAREPLGGWVAVKELSSDDHNRDI